MMFSSIVRVAREWRTVFSAIVRVGRMVFSPIVPVARQVGNGVFFDCVSCSGVENGISLRLCELLRMVFPSIVRVARERRTVFPSIVRVAWKRRMLLLSIVQVARE